MKFFTDKKFLFKLIATLCICFTIFNFCAAPKVQAESTVALVGGKLLNPICALIVALGDGIMEILQKSIMGTSATAIFDNVQEGWFKIICIAIVAIMAIAAAFLVTGGIALGPILAMTAKYALIVGAVMVADQVVTGGMIKNAVTCITAETFGTHVVFPTFTIGPEEIFSGKILMFDPNIFNPKELKEETIADADGQMVTSYYYEEDGEKIQTSMNNAAAELKGTVSKWYYVIRNIAIIGLMLVLLYVGIRMLLSSIASDKAKYKQMLSDWVVALCLVFLMQYIMVFANSFVEGVTNIFENVANDTMETVVITEPKNTLINSVKEIENDEVQYVHEDQNGKEVIVWPTNLMGKIRFATQQEDGTTAYIGYSICYFVLVIYTVMFSITYAKRLLYLLFLTIIAPFVALTFPLDKIRDGQAQAFNTWVKEYIINLIIQPFHLLLYIIFISMAFELAGTNIIYSLVVLGFMVPAEKFLRSMFGFNRANSPGFLSGAAGAALTISAMKSLSSFAKGAGGKGGSGGKGSGDDKSKPNKLRSADSGHTTDDIMDQAIGSGNGNSSSNSPQLNTQNETERLNSNRRVLEEFENEGAASDTWTDGDYQAFQELEEEQLAAERALREQQVVEQEEQARLQQQQEEQEQQLEQAREEEQQAIEEGQLRRRLREGSEKLKGTYLGARLSNFKSDNLNSDKIKQLAKSGAKKTLKFGMGATGAVLGVAAGVAAGSPGDALKYTTAGAVAGSAIGQGLGNKTGATIDKEKAIHEETLRKQYGDKEFKKLKNAELDQEFMKNPEIRKKYAIQFNTKNDKDLDLILDDAKEYRKYGVTDDDTIMKAMSIDRNHRADPKSIAAAKLSASAKSEKDLKTALDRYRKKGANETQVREMENRIRQINKSTLN